MVTYKQLDSVLLQDGKKYAVDLKAWAEKTLISSELAEYQADFVGIDAFYQNLQDTGIFTRSLITKTINVGHGDLIITIGQQYTWLDQRITNEKYDAWQARFAADPNVTYNPEVLQE